MHLTGWIWMFMTVYWARILCNSAINPGDRRNVSLLTEGWWQFVQRCVPRYACVKRSHLFYFYWFSEWNKATCAGKRNWSIKKPIWLSFSKCSHLVVHEGQRFTYMHNKRKPHMEQPAIKKLSQWSGRIGGVFLRADRQRPVSDKRWLYTRQTNT